MLGIILSVASAFFWAAMNFVDKYIVDKHMKNFFGFMPVAGILNVFIGIILFILFPSTLSTGTYFAAAAGFILGVSAFLYYHMLQYDDASSIIGILYTYPILVVAAGFFLLNESITFVFLIGLTSLLIGALIGLVRMHSIKKILVVTIILLIILTAIEEVFSKIAMDSISVLQATAVFSFFLGATQLFALLTQESRTHVRSHLKVLPYLIISEFFTTLAVLVSFAALVYVPVSVFSAVSIIQIVFLLGFEKLYSFYNPKVTPHLKHKMLSLTLIGLGFVLVVLV